MKTKHVAPFRPEENPAGLDSESTHVDSSVRDSVKLKVGLSADTKDNKHRLA